MAPTAGTRLRFKQAKSKKHQAPATKKTPSLKNRIRALDRFLKRGGLDDATRASKQRELQQLQDEVRIAASLNCCNDLDAVILNGLRGDYCFNLVCGKQLEKKGMTEQEKQNAEKYKKFRFVERVKLMRKLKQAKAAMEKATDKAEKKKLSKEFETWRQELLYVFYFPKMEQYISLFPSNPHDEDKLKRQNELRAAAIARYEKEQPLDAFHQFCYNDSGKSEQHAGTANDDGDDGNDNAPASSSHHKHPTSAAELLLKKPSKEEQKRKSKKPSSKKDKKKKSEVVLADQDDNADDDGTAGVRMNSKKTAGSDGGENDNAEDEEDDFFL